MAKSAEDLAAQAERLRRLREMARVSQVTAANAIGVTPRGYQDWEAGRGGISDENLKKVAAYFGTSPDYIEYGVMRRRRGRTPEPFQAVDATHADRQDEQLAAIQQTLQLMRAENETRHAELMSHIDERTEPTRVAPPRRRRA